MQRLTIFSSLAALILAVLPVAQAGTSDARKAIDEYNQKFIQSCRDRDHAADLALWTDDGVDLIQGLDPMIGKATIAHWLEGVEAQTKGAKMLQCDVDWKQIEIHGDTAYEWGINTQTIEIPGQAKPFSNKGKILLILKRQPDGSWKRSLEAWNSSPRPQQEPQKD